MAGERKGQARKTEVKQRGEMREETSIGGVWREQRRGMERRGNNKGEEVIQRLSDGFKGDEVEERRVAERRG